MKSSISNKRHIHLIETEEDYQLLKSLIENPHNKTIGYDTETTGLDYIHDHIVGFCFGVGSPIEGYYLPVRHVIGNNFPVEYGLDLVRHCLESKKTLLMFNKVFDITMTEKEGVYFPFHAKIMDVQIMAHLVMQEKFPSLKKFAQKYLKYKVVEFSEAAKDSEEEKNYNAGDTNPEQFYLYSAADPVYTVDLGRFLWKEYPYIRKIFPIDNIAAEAVRRFSKNVIHLDYSVIRRELEHEEALLREDKLRCFQIAGYEFNPGSNRDKAEALSRFVVLSKKTKSGKSFQVNDEILESIDHPLAEALATFSKRRKYISSYLTPLLATEGTPVRIHYGMVAAPTARMASGTYRGNSFYSPLNIMSIPKVSKKRYIHPDPVLGYILNDNPEGAIGQQKTKAGLRDAFVAPEGYVVVTADFCLDPNVIVQTRTGLKEMRLLKDGEEVLTPQGFKKCINPHYTGKHKVYEIKLKSGEVLRCSGEHKVAVFLSCKGYVWKEVKNLCFNDLILIQGSNKDHLECTSFVVQETDEVIEMMDMEVEDVHCFYANGILVHNCSEELRIATNMSGERVFADAILNGKDLHMETAKTMFGVASEDQRDKVKTINFASLYGATKYTIAKRLKVAVDEAGHMLEVYKKALPSLTRWKEWIVKQGKKTGFVFSYYGRPRAVYQYFKSSDKSMQGFAERTCLNSPIQACIPSSTFIPLNDSVVRMSSVLGQKCLFSDGKYGIVSGRGSSTILYDVFTKSGDFCRVDSNHKLITKSKGEYRTILVQDAYKKSICLSPLKWRLFNPLKFLTVRRPKKHILVQSQHTKVMRTPKLVASFWRCYLSHSKFRIEHKCALDVRALADLCGFNLKYKGSYYVLSLKRPKKSKVTTIIPRVENVPIASATMDGIQIYPAQGFLNKNTGADVMRILLTKLQNEVETNPEFRENVIIGWPVHDEVNSYVKLNYIHDYFYKIKEFMTIKHDNWIVPLEAEIGIGYSWGTCFDVTEVTKDNKLVLPDKYKTEIK